MSSLDRFLNSGDPQQGCLDRVICHLADVFDRWLVLIFYWFYDLRDTAQTLLELVHQSLLTVHLRWVVLLLSLSEQCKPLVKPWSHILFRLQAEWNLVFNFSVKRLKCLVQQLRCLVVALSGPLFSGLLLICGEGDCLEGVFADLSDAGEYGLFLREDLLLKVGHQLRLLLSVLLTSLPLFCKRRPQKLQFSLYLMQVKFLDRVVSRA